MTKTNVMRLLEQASIQFTAMEYEYDENDLSGIHAAEALNMPPEQVFKTLVTKGASGGYFVFCIPVCSELNLKSAAKAAGEKSIEMIHVKELLGITGYMRGGCSPVGMKKKYPTFIDETVILFDKVGVSAGKRGCQVVLSPDDLIRYTDSVITDITV